MNRKVAQTLLPVRFCARKAKTLTSVGFRCKNHPNFRSNPGARNAA
jgi:hypothetical protein